MPKSFDNCVKNGGKVRTIVIDEKKGTYMHVCYKGGHSYPGEVRKKKKAKSDIETLVKELKDLERYWKNERECKS